MAEIKKAMDSVKEFIKKEDPLTLYGKDYVNVDILENYHEALKKELSKEGTGGVGPEGKAATVKVGTVTNGDVVSVTNVGTENEAILNFVLQKGQNGLNGKDGTDGKDGKDANKNLVDGPEGTGSLRMVAAVPNGEFNMPSIDPDLVDEPDETISGTHTMGKNSIALNAQTRAFGENSVAIGYRTVSKGLNTFAAGCECIAGDDTYIIENAHAEGDGCIASGNDSHAEGLYTKATNNAAHSEGHDTEANGECSHAEGLCTIANGFNQHVLGRYNKPNETDVEIVGYGTRSTDRKNIRTLDPQGNEVLAGKLTAADIEIAGLTAENNSLKAVIASLLSKISGLDDRIKALETKPQA